MNSPFDAIEFPEGKVAFDGMIRGDGNEPSAYVFRVELNNREPLYGEWNALFEDNELKTFNFEIISFGYETKNNVNNSNPKTRKSFSKNEKENIEKLIYKLISAKDKADDFKMFPISKSRFLGSINFRDGWINII